MPLESTVDRKERKQRQKERLRSQFKILQDALALVHHLSSGASRNDPESTLRNINAVTTSANDAMKQ